MNRRGFLKNTGVLSAAFGILPSALTYDRIWQPTLRIHKIHFDEQRIGAATDRNDIDCYEQFISSHTGNELTIELKKTLKGSSIEKVVLTNPHKKIHEFNAKKIHIRRIPRPLSFSQFQGIYQSYPPKINIEIEESIR